MQNFLLNITFYSFMVMAIDGAHEIDNRFPNL